MLVVVLATMGVVFGLGSLIVAAQDSGSCPAQPVGSQLICDHAYFVNGAYIWMRPLYTELGIVSLLFLASAAVLGLYLEFGSRPSTAADPSNPTIIARPFWQLGVYSAISSNYRPQ